MECIVDLKVPGLNNTTTEIAWCKEPDNVTAVDTTGWTLTPLGADEGRYVLSVPLALYGSTFEIYEIANRANYSIGTLISGVVIVGAPGTPPGVAYTNPVVWRGQNGQVGINAIIRRVDDGLYWSESVMLWQAAEPAIGVSLPEYSTGLYAGNASYTPGPGVTYEIKIRDASNLPILKSYNTYPGEKRTALQHVNDVQAALRMPQSADFSSAHAKLVLSQINTAISLMVEGAVWPEMKVQGAFYTTAGRDLYQIRPANTQGIEIVERMQIGTSNPISIIPDSEFRAYKLALPTPSQPLFSRIYGRIGDALLIELTPTPNAVYAIDFDAILKVALLSAVTDVPLLDDTMVLLGGTAFAKKEQGEAFTDDMQIFNAKVQGQRDNISEPNWGDAQTT